MHSVIDHPVLRSQIVPLRVEACHALGELGMVEEKTELIHGFVFAKPYKTPRHTLVCQRLLDALRAREVKGNSVWQEQPINCHDSELEPDISVVHGVESEFATRHPNTAALVIEVSI